MITPVASALALLLSVACLSPPDNAPDATNPTTPPASTPPSDSPPAPATTPPAATSPAPAPTDSPTTPLALTERYTAMITEGRGPEAIELFFDLEAISRRAFPEPAFKLTAEEHAQIAAMLKDILIAPYTDPTVGPVLREARYAGFDAVPSTDEPDVTTVSYTVTLKPPINRRLAHALIIRKTSDGNLKVVDADTGRGMTVATMLRTLASSLEQTPVEFVKQLHTTALARLKEFSDSTPTPPKSE